jgi:hypothetical protein
MTDIRAVALKDNSPPPIRKATGDQSPLDQRTDAKPDAEWIDWPPEDGGVS